MKKRLFAITLCIIAVVTMCFFSVSAHAEDVSVVSSDDAVQADEDSTSPTVFTRIWEYVEGNQTEIIGAAGDIAILVLAFVIRRGNTKSNKDIAKNLAALKTDTSETLGSQGSVVNVVNKMITGYNELSVEYQKMKAAYEEYGATEDDRNRVVGALVAQNTAMLEILTTVYANSKNLPQGVKDLVYLKYANCLKSLENDEQLKAIVEAVRNNIGTNKDISEALPEAETEA